MPRYSLIKDSASIVIVGNFNPSIFHPTWFAKHRLLSDRYCNSADVELIHKEIAKMKIDWLEVQVTLNKATFTTHDTSQFEQLRDLVFSVLNILDETPLVQFGLNRDVEYKLNDVSDWHKLGHTLVPKNIWVESSDDISEKDCGVQKLVVQIRNSKMFPVKSKNITVSPTKLSQVYFGVNNHFELKDILEKNNEFSVPAFIQEHWESIIESSIITVESVLTKSLERD